MKPSLTVISLISLSPLALPWAQAKKPVTFELAVDPSGVALQFDLNSTQSLAGFGEPQFLGASEHEVRSATIENGARRFVVYSLDGNAISENGRVTVVFPATFDYQDGVLEIDNVTASDSSGQVVAAAPDALPTLLQTTQSYQTFASGTTWDFAKMAVDLDGAISELRLRANGSDVAIASGAPFALSWGPVASGAYDLSLAATDSAERVELFDLGVFRAFADADIREFDAYASVFYGDDAPSASRAWDADPLRIGISNGFAYLLGLDPRAPDRARLPRVSLERGENGEEMVVRFARREGLSDVTWTARASKDLSSYAAVPAGQVTETERDDGLRAVEIRLPIASGADYQQFVDIEVKRP